MICRRAVLLLCLLAPGLLWAAAQALEDPFPRPPELQDDIRFWTRVYTEIDTDAGFVHDNRHLGVVYEAIEFDTRWSKKQRRKHVERTKKRYRDILLVLAGGKRSALNAEQKRVLALWPADVSSRELKAAAYRLRFQLGQSDKFRAGLIRSGAWEALIRATLREQGVPEALVALPHVESSYNPLARSHRGAAGLWQFTRSTGRRYLRIDRSVDQRLDPLDATVAAARLLKHNLAATGNWPLAITAYNHGSAGVRRAVRKIGTDDITAIVRRYKSRRFGFASRNFYVAFCAALDVMHDAERHFGELRRDPPADLVQLRIDDHVPARVLAEHLGLSLERLRWHNPALRRSVWKGDQHVPPGFTLRLPRAALGDVDAQALLAAIPDSERYPAQLAQRHYRVERGNTLSSIAQRFGVSMRRVIELNDLDDRHLIRVGQVLRLPQPAGRAPATPVTSQAPPADGLYTVRSGESLSLIAIRFGTTESQLVALNALADPDRLYAGQTLVVTGETAPAGSAAAPPQAPAQAQALAAAHAEPPESQYQLEEQTIALVEGGEPASDEEAHELGPAVPPGAHPQLSADPSDYAVADDGTIEVQIPETLGHYAEWLALRSQRLRDLNGFEFGQPVIMGQRLKLDFSAISPEAFEARRRAFHVDLQEAFFTRYRIAGTREHAIVPGDSLWLLSHNTYGVPVWLLRQYNPDLDFDAVRPGAIVTVPKLERRDGAGPADAPVEPRLSTG